MDRVDIGILGSFRILVGGNERVIPARKQRALLALLALHGRRSRADLIVDLWPESSIDRGRDSLRHALYRLRAAVGDDIFSATGEDLGLSEHVTVDARELERLAAAEDRGSVERAVSLYRGPLCAELDTEDAEAAGVRFRGIAASAAERLALRVLANEPRVAAEIARRAIAIDPYREEAHRVLLRALAAAGDRAGAATHYRRLVSQLRDELGVEPSVATKQLYVELSRGLRAESVPIGRPSLEPPAELVGRRAEYARVVGLLSDAIDGRGGAALLVGEAGAGKSRLLDEVGDVAERHGLRVLRARAVPAEGALAFQLWADVLRDFASEASQLPEPWPSILSALVPEAGAAEAAGAVGPELQRTRLFEGVVRLLAHLAEAAPIALTVDDLHHADDDSLHLFHYVARTARNRRIAVVASMRPRTGPVLESAVASLVARGEVDRIELPPLSSAAIEELLGRFGMRRTDLWWLAPRIARWTGGNPLFTLEAVRALIAQGRLRRDGQLWSWSGDIPAAGEPLAPQLPSDVLQTILARVDLLPDATRRLVDLAAAVGSRAPLALLSAVAGREQLAVADDLTPALEAALLRERDEGEGSTIAFSHELMRDATYQHIPLVTRAAIHARIADALERLGGQPAAIAFHLTAAGEAGRAVDHWLASAREAASRFAHEDSARATRAALAALGPTSQRRAQVLALVGDADMRRGAVGSAVAVYDEAIAALPPEAVDERASLATRIARAAKWYERHPRALELAIAAVEHGRTRGQTVALAEALLGLAWVRLIGGDAAAALAAAEEARVLAGGLDQPRAEAEAWHVGVRARWLSGDSLASVPPSDLDRLASRLGDDEQTCALYEISVPGLVRRGDGETAMGVARRELEIARRIGSLRAELTAGQDLADALLTLGRYTEVIEIADEVRSDIASLQLDDVPSLLGVLANGLAHAGLHERALALAEELLAAARARSEPPAHVDYALAALNALLTMGRMPPRDLLEAVRPTCRTCDGLWLLTAGRHAALRGDVEAALALAGVLESDPAGDEPRIAVRPAQIRALAFAAAGRDTEAAAQTARARSLLSQARNELYRDRFERDLAAISSGRA